MDMLWQHVAVGAALVGAAAYLGWYFRRRAFRKKSPCDSCGLMKMAERRAGRGR
ncbi:MAG TPA: hypothetical protein PKM94_12315 [candidate division Zixibacteria bacterium]|nr:hypothetical protein [candidate division Zixibacteria bacterium]HQL25102.1 hypothetical protein [candidate division Zixibacteria bacterium]